MSGEDGFGPDIVQEETASAVGVLGKTRCEAFLPTKRLDVSHHSIMQQTQRLDVERDEALCA